MGDFAAWLEQFSQVSGSIGDLAKDVAADPEWPDGPDTLDAYLDHLEAAHGLDADSPAAEALRQAWEHYERARG
ncbi:YozE family protein [Kitasatospora sp. NPDC093550]|uniref:YozE family protein n=1 Tax=Kitasatospora sp. NPDC093550 TaxID=3364089 RepID=UPI003807EDA2